MILYVDGCLVGAEKSQVGWLSDKLSLIKVHIDALQLEVGVAVVGAGRIYAVLVGDDLPELGTDLVTALASLDVDDLAHI